jgi:glycosyltransferase involved in cell wall biosynthesis
VVPIYNEEESIVSLYEELKETADSFREDVEIIFIDDGSSDKSLKILKEIRVRDDNVVVVRFRKNFGQTAALAAGFDYASGEIIVTLDGDLQNDPRDIPRMIDKLNEGYDMVTGWRYDRKDKFLSRRLPSIIANKIISYTTNVKLHDYGCTLKVFKKDVADSIKLYGEMHRFIPAIASAMGVSIAEVKVNHRSRKFGTSKYGISRTIRVVLDLITVKFLLSYATRPIQIFGLLGFLSGFAGFSTALYLTIQRQFFDVPIANRPLLLLAILLIFIGLQFITLGLLAEIQVRIYHETQDKPIYVVREVIGYKS